MSLGVNFNESLTNDAVNFEQLGPDKTAIWAFACLRLHSPHMSQDTFSLGAVHTRTRACENLRNVKQAGPSPFFTSMPSGNELHCVRSVCYKDTECANNKCSNQYWTDLQADHEDELRWFSCVIICALLTFITRWANSAADKQGIDFIFFPDHRLCHFMQTDSKWDNLQEFSVFFSV